MNTKIKRMLHGLTQKELAALVGTSNVTIVKIEKGNIESIKFGTLKKIAEVLGSSVTELFLNEK